jgi:hypothetical protein
MKEETKAAGETGANRADRASSLSTCNVMFVFPVAVNLIAVACFVTF